MYWAGVFFALAVATGLFAFSGIASGASGAAQIVFVACLLFACLRYSVHMFIGAIEPRNLFT
jgi:uncharacterized membrane protein YtjA (UPF0391 family)